MKTTKKCAMCGKVIRDQNTTSLCRFCYVKKKQREYRNQRKKAKRCITCKKKVNPIVIYPDGLNNTKIVKYPIRCYSCRIKQKTWREQWKENVK